MLLSIAKAFAPSLFRLLEKKFGAKTGDAKMSTAVSAFEVVLNAFAAAGKIDGTAPTREILRAVLEEVLADEKGKPDWQEAATLAMDGRTFEVLIVREIR